MDQIIRGTFCCNIVCYCQLSNMPVVRLAEGFLKRRSSFLVFQNADLFNGGAFRRCSNFSAGVSENREDLVVKIGGKNEIFPLVWLRDNCQCEKCFHTTSTSRIINWNTFDVNAKVDSVRTSGETVTLRWNDNHSSTFAVNWLKKRSFSAENQKTFLKEYYRSEKILWSGNQLSGFLEQMDYHEVMSDDNALQKHLQDLSRCGVSLLKNVPIERDETLKLAKKIGRFATRRTHYGETFEVVSKPGTSNVAYLSDFLQMHTDLPYYEYKPGVIYLHCLEQTVSDGGESLLSDGFYVAEKMRSAHPEAFETLTRVKVNWFDVGQENGERFHSVFRSPVIELDEEGKLVRVRHSVPQRDSFFTSELKDVKCWYQALRTFVDLLNEHVYKFKTNPGEILAFDNTRLVHGRLGYRDTSSNTRFLVGMYVDWDEIYSKMRVLKSKLETC